jgi:hypothetical protein
LTSIFQTFLVDDAREFLDLGIHEIGELLRRSIVGHSPHLADILFDVITREHRLHLAGACRESGSAGQHGAARQQTRHR